jgi:hypothetical protein
MVAFNSLSFFLLVSFSKENEFNSVESPFFSSSSFGEKKKIDLL